MVANTPNQLTEVRQTIESMRTNAKGARKFAIGMLASAAVVMLSGAYVFFSAGQIVATDRAQFNEEKLRLKLLKEQLEAIKTESEKAQGAAQAAREQAQKVQNEANAVFALALHEKDQARKLKEEADKSIIVSERRLAELKSLQSLSKK
jgi:hypothetical protein